MGQNCYGNNLVVFAAAFALKISQGMSADEINILGALFSVVGDQLALLAATKQAAQDCAQNAAQNSAKDGGNNSDGKSAGKSG